MKIVSLFASFPVSILAMAFQGPITHRTEDYAVKDYDCVNRVKAMPVLDLLREIESLQENSEFINALPIIIEELNAEEKQLKDKVPMQTCCIYGKCLATTGAACCASVYIAAITHSFDVSGWCCTGGALAAFYKCDNECKYQNRIRQELQIKIGLLRQKISQLKLKLPEIVAISDKSILPFHAELAVSASRKSL